MGSPSDPLFPLAALPRRAPRRLRLAFALLLTLPLLIAPGATGLPGAPEASAAAPDPETCEGYPEERVFLEAQDWWQPTLHGSEDFGHVHVGACFPRTHLEDGSPNEVSGTLRLDVRVMMHDNPGLLRFVRVHLADGDDTHRVLRDFIDERCEEGGPNWDDGSNSCVWWKQIEVDTTASNYDGFQEIRLAANVRQENTDDSMFATTGWQVYLDNGEEVRHRHTHSDGTHRELMEGRGWYEGAGYTVARLEERLPHTVSGVWEPQVRMRDGAGGIDVHHSFASVNGNFHHDDPGQVLLDQSGAFQGRLSIDTTQLPDGPNRLFLRADAPCDGSDGNDCGFRDSGASLNDATNSGALAITFHVDNGNPVEDDSGGHDHGSDGESDAHDEMSRDDGGACPSDLPPAGFSDTRDSVHESAIDCMRWWGITSGLTPTTFAPRDDVSRAQIATFLHRMLGETALLPADAPRRSFSDVPSGHTHRTGIEVLAGLEVANGTSATEFSPTPPATRGQMASLIVRMHEDVVGEAIRPSSNDFDDVAGSTHETSIQKLVAIGVASGYGDGSFRPGASVTRGQMAAFVMRYVDHLVAAQLTTPPAA